MRKRWELLAEIIKQENYKVCAEIGVKSGRNIAEILRRTQGTFFYAIDPWAPTEDYSYWPNHYHTKHETAFDRVASRFPGRIRKMKMLSSEAAPWIDDGSLDFIFIDGDHSYEGVKLDIELWLSKVRKGGVMAGHDFDNTALYGDAFKGVDRAVREAFEDNFELGVDHVWYTMV